MFGKVIVFGLFEMIRKKKSEDRVPRFGLRVGSGTMAQAVTLPISFWGNALLTNAYILNRVPSQSVSSTTYELWHGKKPNLEHLRP